MATSSITEPFYCKDAKAANTIVRLMFSEKVPASWCAPESPDVRGVLLSEMSAAERRRIVDRFRRKHNLGKVRGANA